MDLKKEFDIELEKIGKRIKQIRKERNLTLSALEVLSKINDSDISRYERGMEMLEVFTLFRLAKAMEVEIFHFTNPDAPIPECSKRLALFIKKSGKKSPK